MLRRRCRRSRSAYVCAAALPCIAAAAAAFGVLPGCGFALNRPGSSADTWRLSDRQPALAEVGLATPTSGEPLLGDVASAAAGWAGGVALVSAACVLLRGRTNQRRGSTARAGLGDYFKDAVFKQKDNDKQKAPSTDLGTEGLSGAWGSYECEGDIDAYWKAVGLPWLARQGFKLMDWGCSPKTTNMREFRQTGDDIEMNYYFTGVGGLGFIEKYTVGAGIQEITRMGGSKILVEPIWEAENVLKVTNMSPDKSVLDIHRFYLQGDAKDTLVLEADSSPSGGPTVKWFLKK
eukprot:TRINITY_DN11455_c0_g1_i1.p1 TRINITY_DN11455_c0_g1~~TRINITY_DN11455_c0_g1_i1.p1  ORF type:complete len:291 (+),score=77.20 TRINITY_DN11455_c0_g1_i1:153-1025(+)